MTDVHSFRNGSVAVTVELRNPQDTGLILAAVDPDRDTPPPELQFEYVPADSSCTGQFVCPPGTKNPKESVTSWIEACG